jgi:hypothetical protein
MSENLQLKEIAGEFAEGEIDQDEHLRRTMDELIYQHSCAFWCRVMEERRINDPQW